jgi:predicted patatin/cPLA2 family phospholipase
MGHAGGGHWRCCVNMTVRDLLRMRRETHSIRAHRADPHHLALVIEGGGMRGVVASAMTTALQKRSLLNSFDSIHGSSAGACAGAYFLAGQAGLSTRTYYEDINNRRFINRWRPAIGRPVLNTHFLIDHVMRVIKPLDVNQILSAGDVLHVVTTDAQSGEARIYNQFRNIEHFFSVLKASITIPVMAGAPVEVDGVRLVDGGMVQQIALQSAIRAGASHVLVLMTRKQGGLERQDRTPQLALESLLLRLFLNAKLAAVYRDRNQDINKVLALIQDTSQNPRIEAIVRPAHASNVDRLTTDTTLLKAADQEAQRAVFNYLDGTSDFEKSEVER